MDKLIETPLKKIDGKKLLEEVKANAKANKAPKAPRTIKLITIWKTAVYLFAIIGVVFSVVFVHNAFNGYIDSQVQARTSEVKTNQ